MNGQLPSSSTAQRPNTMEKSAFVAPCRRRYFSVNATPSFAAMSTSGDLLSGDLPTPSQHETKSELLIFCQRWSLSDPVRAGEWHNVFSTTQYHKANLHATFSLTCRQRKLKCDESKPVCAQCKRANRECRPSDSVVFRHQQNASLNGAGTRSSGSGSLSSFYNYRNTYHGGNHYWVDVPRQRKSQENWLENY